jgi:hypothetical protein
MIDLLWLALATLAPLALFGLAAYLEARLFPPHRAAQAARGELSREPGW